MGTRRMGGASDYHKIEEGRWSCTQKLSRQPPAPVISDTPQHDTAAAAAASMTSCLTPRHQAPPTMKARSSSPAMPERFCPVSEPVCLLVNSPRANPNGHPLVSTREFQQSLLTRTAASSKSVPTTRGTSRLFIAINSCDSKRLVPAHVRLYLVRCLLSRIQLIVQIHHPREYIQSVYPNYIRIRTN